MNIFILKKKNIICTIVSLGLKIPWEFTSPGFHSAKKVRRDTVSHIKAPFPISDSDFKKTRKEHCEKGYPILQSSWVSCLKTNYFHLVTILYPHVVSGFKIHQLISLLLSQPILKHMEISTTENII